MEVLFTAWDGADGGYLEPLYFPLFAALKDRDINVHTLQFSWCGAQRFEELQQSARLHGLRYQPVPVNRGASAQTAVRMIPKGAKLIQQYVLRNGIEVLMPRSIIPAAMALLARKIYRLRTKLVFDADGMMHDERVDFGGMSRNSLQYKLLRSIESLTASAAASTIVRSRDAAIIMRDRADISPSDPARFVIAYNGRDPDIYSPGSAVERCATRRKLRVPTDHPLVIYVGSLGPKYALSELSSTIRHLLSLKSEPWLRILSRPGAHLEALLRELSGYGERVSSAFVPSDQVPNLIAASDFGLALISPAFSTQAVFPVKISEYLLCGVPIISLHDTGDVERLAAESQAIILLSKGQTATEELTHWFEACYGHREQLRSEARELGLRYCTTEQMAERFEAALIHV